MASEIPKVSVVLPCGGMGMRLGSSIPKQLIHVHSEPLFCYALKAFLKIKYVKVIVLVVPDNERLFSAFNSFLPEDKSKIQMVTGGSTRHESIYKGLKYLEDHDEMRTDVVVIHDAVRPFVEEDILSKVVLAAQAHGAAGVIRPLESTVLSVKENNFLRQSLDRHKHQASEMPQAFRHHIIMMAYELCTPEDMKHGTECLHIVQKYKDINARLIPGTPSSWKVTYLKDLYGAKGMIKVNQPVGILGVLTCPFLQSLQRVISFKFSKVQAPLRKMDYNLQNFVHIHPNRTLNEVFECHGIALETFVKPVAIVHLLFNWDKNPDIPSLQRRANQWTRNINPVVVTYYVILDGDFSRDLMYPNAFKLVASLLFDRNEDLNGHIFLA